MLVFAITVITAISQMPEVTAHSIANRPSSISTINYLTKSIINIRSENNVPTGRINSDCGPKISLTKACQSIFRLSGKNWSLSELYLFAYRKFGQFFRFSLYTLLISHNNQWLISPRCTWISDCYKLFDNRQEIITFLKMISYNQFNNAISNTQSSSSQYKINSNTHGNTRVRYNKLAINHYSRLSQVILC